eukprot:gb/GECG01001464.1/.p1 GENE.gb/GECG01001464.1/~~gb/GECG01001464.1/.p1  ORF type:complete len:286 (+),score=41.40 gb/GECG01001464.1/:1-858(+)
MVFQWATSIASSILSKGTKGHGYHAVRSSFRRTLSERTYFGMLPQTRHQKASFSSDSTFSAPEATDSPDVVWEKLQRGNKRFMEGKVGKFTENPLRKPITERRKELLDGQTPVATILTCADSRISPELTFDCDIGMLFVTRNAGNVVDDDVIATIEFGIEIARTPLLLVLGHEDCMAVGRCIKTVQTDSTGRMQTELQDPDVNSSPMEKLMEKIRPAVLNAASRLKGKNLSNYNSKLYNCAIEENIRQQMEAVEKIEAVQRATREGRLRVLGVKYLLDSGEAKII